MDDCKADNNMEFFSRFLSTVNKGHDASTSLCSSPVVLPLVTAGEYELEQEDDGNGDKSDTLSVL